MDDTFLVGVAITGDTKAPAHITAHATMPDNASDFIFLNEAIISFPSNCIPCITGVYYMRR